MDEADSCMEVPYVATFITSTVADAVELQLSV